MQRRLVPCAAKNLLMAGKETLPGLLDLQRGCSRRERGPGPIYCWGACWRPQGRGSGHDLSPGMHGHADWWSRDRSTPRNSRCANSTRWREASRRRAEFWRWRIARGRPGFRSLASRRRCTGGFRKA